MRRVLTLTMALAGLGGTLSGAPAPDGVRQNMTVVAPASPAPAEPAESLDAADVPSIVRKWGVRIESLRLTATGVMLDLRYTVVDARKAKPLFERRSKPVLLDEASGIEVPVPVPAKTGALRNSNDPIAGRTYFMFFTNPGRFIKPGNRVTLTIGPFRVSGIPVLGEGRGGSDQ